MALLEPSTSQSGGLGSNKGQSELEATTVQEPEKSKDVRRRIDNMVVVGKERALKAAIDCIRLL